jgi:hypothetical protein
MLSSIDVGRVEAPPLASLRLLVATFLATSFEKLNDANVIWTGGTMTSDREAQIRLFTLPFIPT